MQILRVVFDVCSTDDSGADTAAHVLGGVLRGL